MKKPMMALLLAVLFSGFTFTNVPAYDGYDEEGTVEISLPKMVSSTLSDNSAASVNVENINYSNKYITANINKPVVKIKNEAVQNKINGKISSAIARFEESVAAQSKEDNKFNEDNGLDVKQYVVNVNNSLKYNKNGILSIVLELYSYTGGAHGMTKAVPFNFDLNTGNAGVLEDFLGNNKNYKEIILSAVKSKISKNPEMYFEDQVNKYNDVPYNQKFYLDENGIVILFDEYELAPYAAGILEFMIPYGEFPEGIKQNINIKEEAAGIYSFLIRDSCAVNTYLNYPCFENLPDKSAEAEINGYLRGEIDDFIISVIRKNSDEPDLKLKGITTYFKAVYKDKRNVILTISYSASDERDSEIIAKKKNYTIDLDSGKIFSD